MRKALLMLVLGVVTRITYLRYNSLCYLVPKKS